MPARLDHAVRTIALVAILSAPARATTVDAIFSDGFDDPACAWGAASADACGPGHLVLIGNDYAPVAARPASTESPAVLDEIEQVLVNAVAQSHATQLARATRIAILDENAEVEELGHIDSVLSSAFTLDATLVPLSGVAAALDGSDVLLIPDQNGYFKGAGAEAAAQQLAPNLRTFLDKGGVVVVLDGTYLSGGSPVPSENYRALGAELLQIGAAASFTGCAEVPCNDEDPLLAGIAGDVCASGNTVGFATDEPWVALARRDGVSPDRPFVLHRWFGATDAGPIALDLDDADASADLRGNSVFFQDANGQSHAQCTTLSNGTAVHQMGPNAFVSLGVNSGSRQLITVIGAQPLDRLEQRAPAAGPGGANFEVTASLPGAFDGANAYRVVVGCDSVLSGNLTIVVDTPSGCSNPDGSFNVIAEALDNANQVIAYTIANGVTDATPQPIAMPAWQAPNLVAFTSGTIPSGLQQVALDVRMRADGGVDYLEGGAPVLRGSTGTFPFYSDAGPGQPPFAELTHHARLRFLKGALLYNIFSERTARGQLPASLAVDYADFLPKLTGLTAGFDPSQRYKVDWTLAATAPGADGGIAAASWNRDFVFYQWLIVFPPGTTLTAPPNPGGDGDLFWPDAQADSVTLDSLRLDDATFLPSYRDYRQDVLGAKLPPSEGDYILRTTQAQLAPL